MNETVTRADLGEAVHRAVGLGKSESIGLVKISSFGTLSVRNKSERIGRNPKTGEEVPITPRRVLSFRPSNVLKTEVDEGNKARR